MKLIIWPCLLAAAGCSGGALASCPAQQQYTVQMTATGLDAYEGETVRLMTSVAKPDGCRGDAAAVVDRGTVALTIHNGFTPSLAVYPSVAAYVDRDGDSRCNDRLTWSSIMTAFADRPTTVMLTSADFTDRDSQACPLFP